MGMNQILWLIFPLKHKMNKLNSPNTFIPLHGSPIQTPLLGISIILVTIISLWSSIDVENPNSCKMKLDCSLSNLEKRVNESISGFISWSIL